MSKCFDPKVSIVIPVYNGSNYVKEAIDSALSQTYTNIEIIVINDGSTDGGATDKICRSYGTKIRYFVKENGGVASALNMGIEKMEGEYFSWLSHDDVYYPNKVERQIKFLSRIPNNSRIIPYANYELIDHNSQSIKELILDHEMLMRKPEYALLRGSVNGITLLIPKAAFEEHGSFDLALKCTQDYDMWRRLMRTYQFAHMDEIFTKTRIHPQQDSNKHPNVITEGDPLWIGLMEDIPRDRKEILEGSEYNFFREMNIFLKSTPYEGAMKYAKKRMEEIFNDTYGTLKDIKVSVIIPFFNRIAPLLKSIDSVKKQTYKNLEILLINDCSTNDISKLDKYIKEDTRFKIINLKENSGPAKARNIGIDKATGEYIAFLDSDDEFTPEKIEYQLTEMYLTKYNVSHTSYIAKSSIRERKIDVGFMSGNVIPWIVASCQIATPTVMIKREYLNANKFRFPEDFRIGEDTCFWLTILRNTKLLGLEKFYTIVHVNEGSASNNTRKQLEGLTNILRFLFMDNEYSQYHHEISNIAKRFVELSDEITLEDFPSGKEYDGMSVWGRKPSNPISKLFYLFKYQGFLLTIKKVIFKYGRKFIKKFKGE